MRRVFLGRKAAGAAVSSYIGVPGQEEAMRSVKPKLTTRGVLLSPALFALALLPRLAAAQEFEDVQPSTGILALKQQGSFFIGGHAHAVPDPYAGVGAGARPGNSMINQMYVQFQKPARSNNLPPIVFVHGCCLSSKTWETTPDGRMGWYEYFTRNGFDTYMGEQSGRARSGFNGTIYNDVKKGLQPLTAQPPVLLGTAQFAWSVFRFGPSFGAVWPDEQFPMDHVSQLYK